MKVTWTRLQREIAASQLWAAAFCTMYVMWQEEENMADLTPVEVVERLDRFIVGQASYSLEAVPIARQEGCNGSLCCDKYVDQELQARHSCRGYYFDGQGTPTARLHNYFTCFSACQQEVS